MRWNSFRFEKTDRTLLERLFEPPAIGTMSPMARIVVYGLLIFWSAFVLFPIYWVVITAFKDAAAVNQGPYFIPFLDFKPNLDAWRVHLSTDPYCDGYAIGRQFVLLAYNSLALFLSPFVRIEAMGPQICKLFLAFTNSLVISIMSTALCVTVGSMAAYALARVQYKPKFGNIVVFVILILIVIVTTSYVGIPWYVTSAVALALFFLLARTLGKRFTATLGNRDIL